MWGLSEVTPGKLELSSQQEGVGLSREKAQDFPEPVLRWQEGELQLQVA